MPGKPIGSFPYVGLTPYLRTLTLKSEKKEFFERKALVKYVDGEGRAASPVQIPFKVIRDNALKKFTDDRPNMVVVVDDLMISPAEARGVNRRPSWGVASRARFGVPRRDPLLAA